MKIVKKYFVLPLFLLVLSCGQATENTKEKIDSKMASVITTEKEVKTSKSITISGEIKDAKIQTINLYQLVAGSKKNLFKSFDTDENGKFSVTLNLEQPDFYIIEFSTQNEKTLVLYQDDISITVNEKGVKVEGSLDTNYLDEYLEIDERLMKKMAKMRESYAQASDKAAAQNAFNEFITGAIGEFTSFISAHKESIVAILPSQKIDTDENIVILNELATSLRTKYPNADVVKGFTDNIDAVMKTAIGEVAPDITLNSTEGKEIKLSSLKGKYVMIDFWASWCGPCRKENPNVVRMYNKYKNKGFEIYGVSLDKKRESWLKAIEKDKLTWLHVSDLKHWQSQAAQTYNVTGIPMTYLIDEKGVIVAKNLRGAALDRKLAEVLN